MYNYGGKYTEGRDENRVSEVPFIPLGCQSFITCEGPKTKKIAKGKKKITVERVSILQKKKKKRTLWWKPYFIFCVCACVCACVRACACWPLIAHNHYYSSKGPRPTNIWPKIILGSLLRKALELASCRRPLEGKLIGEALSKSKNPKVVCSFGKV